MFTVVMDIEVSDDDMICTEEPNSTEVTCDSLRYSLERPYLPVKVFKGSDAIVTFTVRDFLLFSLKKFRKLLHSLYSDADPEQITKSMILDFCKPQHITTAII